jgi:hypothetical protein
MNKKLTTLLSLMLVASVSFAQTLDFSTSNGFSIDPTYDTMGSSAGVGGITFSGLDNQVISGVWSSAQDLTGWGTSFTEAHVLGSMSQIQSSLYSVTLYDSSFATITLTGGEWGKIDSTTDSVDLIIPTSAFAWNDISAIDINTGGAGSSIAGTLSSITVVPEPSTYALIAGFAAFLFVAIRRRK